MSGDAVAGKEHPGVLDLAIRVEQLRADGGNILELRLIEQGFEPVFLNDLDVVVEEQEMGTRRLAGGNVVETRPVERLQDLDDDVAILPEPGLPFVVLIENVVDTDDLDVLVAGDVAEALDAGPDQSARRAGRNDDGDDRVDPGPWPASVGRRYAAVLDDPIELTPRQGAPEGLDFRFGKLDRCRIAFGQHALHVVHGLGVLGQRQHEVVVCRRIVDERADVRAAHQLDGRAPGTTDVIGRKCKRRRPVRLEECFRAIDCRADAALVGIEEIHGVAEFISLANSNKASMPSLSPESRVNIRSRVCACSSMPSTSLPKAEWSCSRQVRCARPRQ